MPAPTRLDFILKGKAAALANEKRPRPHAGSWQREAFLEGYDAVVFDNNKTNQPKKTVTPPEGSVPLLGKYCPAIRNRLQQLGLGQWDQCARVHTLNLLAVLGTETNEKRANRVHLKILGLMGRHGIKQENSLAA